MDEEEVEINVMGDTSSPSIIPLVSEINTELLNCEYTVHPQWLLDNPSANPDCWYNNSTDNSMESLDHESLGHISTENSITDESGWTEKEKHLLERGIEIFGKSAIRLAQFIGTKTSAEVRYYLKSFYTELHPIHSSKNSSPKYDGSGFDEVLLIDSEIPCVSEQIITNKPKMTNKREKVEKKSKNIRIKLKANNLAKKRRKIDNRNKSKHSLLKDNIIPESVLKISNDKRFIECSEEIVNIKKAESSDSEIDVDVDVEPNKFDDIICYSEKPNFRSETKSVKFEERCSEFKCTESSENNSSTDEQQTTDDNSVSSNLSKDVIDQLTSLEIPKNEFVFPKDKVLDLEKFVYMEFFFVKGCQLKSTKDYMLLRNDIICRWNDKKPQYLTKTDIRKSINRFIDNNTLSKIHTFLEQLGAINYGCSRVRYVRPLQRLIKSPKLLDHTNPKRFKKKFLNNGEGGCTVSHGADGEIIDTTIVNKDPLPSKPKVVKRQPIYLIYCKSLNEKPKYSVKLEIGTLLLMDFHAHSSLTEVIGLIGGSWNSETRTLTIKHYEPCKNLASSTTHCDMCPVSQAQSADKINGLKMDLLGWFHSHPTFAPEPSQQDLDTQQMFQEWIGDLKPCVGLILSPFNRPKVLTPSEFRCMVVQKLNGVSVPFKFKVEIDSGNFDVDEFSERIREIYSFICSCKLDNVDSCNKSDSFKDFYMYDNSMTVLDKYISSVRMTLDKFVSDSRIVSRVCESVHNICDKNVSKV